MLRLWTTSWGPRRWPRRSLRPSTLPKPPIQRQAQVDAVLGRQDAESRLADNPRDSYPDPAAPNAVRAERVGARAEIRDSYDALKDLQLPPLPELAEVEIRHEPVPVEQEPGRVGEEPPPFVERRVETYTGFRGSGRQDRGSVYGEFSDSPILGLGRYVALSEEDAKIYGPNVTRETLHIANPLEVTDDAQWRQITRAAGLEYPNPVAFEVEKTNANVDKLRSHIEGQGYGGVIVRMDPRGDNAKTLRDVFGHDQAVSFDLRPSTRNGFRLTENDVRSLLQAVNPDGTVDTAKIPGGTSDRIRVLLQLEQLAVEAEGSAGLVGAFQYNTEQDTYSSDKQWYAVRSPMPKELQETFGLKEAAGVLRKGLEGKKKLTPKQQAWFDTAVRLARRGGGSLFTPYNLVELIHEYGQKMPEVEEWDKTHRAAIGGNVESGNTQLEQETLATLADWFGQEAAAGFAAQGKAVPMAGVSEETSVMPGGEKINRLNPPDAHYREAIRYPFNLPVEVQDFQKAVEGTLKPLYGIEKDVRVTLDDVPMSSTVSEGDGYHISLSKGADAYELLHEFAEVRVKEGQKAFTAHDNNAIADRFIRDAIGETATAQSVLSEGQGVLESLDPETAATIKDGADEIGVGNSASFAGAAALQKYGRVFLERTGKPGIKDAGRRRRSSWGVVNTVHPQYKVARQLPKQLQRRKSSDRRFKAEDLGRQFLRTRLDPRGPANDDRAWRQGRQGDRRVMAR